MQFASLDHRHKHPINLNQQPKLFNISSIIAEFVWESCRLFCAPRLMIFISHLNVSIDTECRDRVWSNECCRVSGQSRAAFQRECKPPSCNSWNFHFVRLSSSRGRARWTRGKATNCVSNHDFQNIFLLLRSILRLFFGINWTFFASSSSPRQNISKLFTATWLSWLCGFQTLFSFVRLHDSFVNFRRWRWQKT